MEGFFQPLHLLILLFSTVIVFGALFLAVFFLSRHVEAKKSKGLECEEAEYRQD
jgi:hypothetical protein